jgi:hypothetical protein
LFGKPVARADLNPRGSGLAVGLNLGGLQSSKGKKKKKKKKKFPAWTAVVRLRTAAAQTPGSLGWAGFQRGRPVGQ